MALQPISTPELPTKHRLNTISHMSSDEIMDLSFHLQNYHAIFNKFFSVGKPVFDPAIPTAAVYAERSTGKFLYMKINPFFWEKQTLTQKLFIVSHECLHLILNHLTRLSQVSHPKIANYAKDLVVNHMSVEKFDFKRSEIDPDNNYCWVDKFFKPEENIKTNETAEYYYALLMKKHENGELPNNCDLVDEHSNIDQSDIDNFIDSMNDVLTPEEKEYLKDILQQHGAENTEAGEGGGPGTWTFFNIKVKKKKKWETVIKKWAIQTTGRKEKISDQWARVNRRFAFLGKDLFLPSEMETDEAHKEKKKIKIHFYLDTSGSCHHLADRFFTAAKSLPEDRFDIRLFCFHDYVVETDITQDGVHMGGGTNFQIIENNIQKLIKSGDSYPYVWCISDGYGTPFSCEHPEKWYWFLSEGNSTQYIPKKSQIFKLTDYE